MFSTDQFTRLVILLTENTLLNTVVDTTLVTSKLMLVIYLVVLM